MQPTLVSQKNRQQYRSKTKL